MNIRFSLG